MLVGLPATVANATSRVGVLVGFATGAAGFRREGISEARIAVRLLPVTLAGSWLGAWIASSLSDEVFSRAFGLVMLLALPVLVANPRPRSAGAHHPLRVPLEQVVYFAIGVYGGAIQAGIGIPLILALVGWSGLDLVRAASARVWISGAATAVALAWFVVAGKIVWPHAIALAAGQSIGGYVAARVGARLGTRLIRPVLITCVVALAIRMLVG